MFIMSSNKNSGYTPLVLFVVILMDYADDNNLDFDELLIEMNRKGTIWLHFAVRPKDNRRKILFLSV